MPVRIDGVEAGLLSRIEQDGIPIIGIEEAESQEIRPLTLAIANMMPAPAMESTEVQWSRLANDPVLQTRIQLIKFDDDPREAPGRSRASILGRYTPFSEAKTDGIDCLVITGDNLELEPSQGLSTREPLGLDEIKYKEQLLEMIEWSAENVPVTILSCLAAHFGLNYLHHIPKTTLTEKAFGIFEHDVTDESDPLMKGMGGMVIAPHSRWGDVGTQQIEATSEETGLKILAASPTIGWLVIKEVLPNGNMRIFIQGHPEYDCNDLRGEYERDREYGHEMLPVDYFPDNNPDECPRFVWEPYTRNLQRNILGEIYRISEARRAGSGF